MPLGRRKLKKMNMRTIFFKNPVYVKSGFTIVGPKEADGNFGDYFDVCLKDDLWCEKSYEKCESKMHRDAITGAIHKAGLKKTDVDFMFAGDLINECAPTALAARNFPTAFFGLYNACSTFTEAVLLGSMLIDGGFANNVTCSTSSHYSTAERQYRFPLELGNQRPPTSQWTVTGAGCTVLSAEKPTLANFHVYEDEIIAISTGKRSKSIKKALKSRKKS